MLIGSVYVVYVILVNLFGFEFDVIGIDYGGVFVNLMILFGFECNKVFEVGIKWEFVDCYLLVSGVLF